MTSDVRIVATNAEFRFLVAGIPITCTYSPMMEGYNYSAVDNNGETISMFVTEIQPYPDVVRLISLAYQNANEAAHDG